MSQSLTRDSFYKWKCYHHLESRSIPRTKESWKGLKHSEHFFHASSFRTSSGFPLSPYMRCRSKCHQLMYMSCLFRYYSFLCLRGLDEHAIFRVRFTARCSMGPAFLVFTFLSRFISKSILYGDNAMIAAWATANVPVPWGRELFVWMRTFQLLNRRDRVEQ